MNTLLLCLVGPMQSWGVQSLFPERDTTQVPSKSSVIGLLCAALGRPRYESIDDLASLKMGVRIDRQGIFSKDFQTAQNVATAQSEYDIKKNEIKVKTKSTAIISDRYYLADACFLVGFEGDEMQYALLKTCHAALENPHWALFLGRKSFIPSLPPYLEDGLLENIDLKTALTTYKWLGARDWQDWQEKPAKLRLTIENKQGEESCNDQPISYELGNRRFAPRRVSVSYCDTPLK